MAKVIMVQGTMSNAGKSLLCAGLCRIFKQDGYRVMPFKSQNMALNSFITREGLEMGRAQVVQAEAAGEQPGVWMNPILLKPTNDIGSQVIVNGRVLGNMDARDYFAFKKQLIPEIMAAFHHLEEQADIIVIEGAGSPAEINLKENDIVNMGLAELVDAPVLLVGDIDRGGVFAQLLGTLLLLEKEERERVKGLIINKFRGDRTILDPGIRMLQERCGVSVTGVVPYMKIALEEEDSLTERFEQKEAGEIDLAVIRYPRISNFTDFDVFGQMKEVSVRYVSDPARLGNPDMIFLPGSKNTLGDLTWMRSSGMETAVKKLAGSTVVMGICGGYQMLGQWIDDPGDLEEGGSMRGMELLPVKTVLRKEKVTTQVMGRFVNLRGILSPLNGKPLAGYEIHMGITQSSVNIRESTEKCIAEIFSDAPKERKTDGMQAGNVYGTYIHGIFDSGDIAESLIALLAKKKGVTYEGRNCLDYRAYRETQYDLLADTLREHLDMEYIWEIMK